METKAYSVFRLVQLPTPREFSTSPIMIAMRGAHGELEETLCCGEEVPQLNRATARLDLR